MAKVQNFQSKSERKSYRKSLIRTYIANKAADVKQDLSHRSNFFRTMRIKKQNRHRVAQKMAAVVSDLKHAKSAVTRWDARSIYADPDLVDEATRLLNKAIKEAQENASEYRRFAYERIYYRKDAVA